MSDSTLALVHTHTQWSRHGPTGWHRPGARAGRAINGIGDFGVLGLCGVFIVSPTHMAYAPPNTAPHLLTTPPLHLAPHPEGSPYGEPSAVGGGGRSHTDSRFTRALYMGGGRGSGRGKHVRAKRRVLILNIGWLQTRRKACSR